MLGQPELSPLVRNSLNLWTLGVVTITNCNSKLQQPNQGFMRMLLGLFIGRNQSTTPKYYYKVQRYCHRVLFIVLGLKYSITLLSPEHAKWGQSLFFGEQIIKNSKVFVVQYKNMITKIAMAANKKRCSRVSKNHRKGFSVFSCKKCRQQLVGSRKQSCKVLPMQKIALSSGCGQIFGHTVTRQSLQQNILLKLS